MQPYAGDFNMCDALNHITHSPPVEEAVWFSTQVVFVSLISQ